MRQLIIITISMEDSIAQKKITKNIAKNSYLVNAITQHVPGFLVFHIQKYFLFKIDYGKVYILFQKRRFLFFGAKNVYYLAILAFS